MNDDEKNKSWSGFVTECKEGYVSTVRIQMVKEGELFYGNRMVCSAEDVVKMVAPLFEFADREKMVIISFTAAMEPVVLEIAAVGGVSYCGIDMKNIFKHALLANAVSIICVHNHPSGDATPSMDDKRITEKMLTAGKYLDIELKDHIIYGTKEQYYSFKDNGWKGIHQ